MKHEVRAADGFSLAASLFVPKVSRGVVVVNSGTGIAREFYEKFATHLAGAGFTTLTYDYRGIGGSRPKSLRGFSASLSSWGRLDISGALRAARDLAGAAPVFVVGHSAGGQLLGLAEGIEDVAGITTVGSSSGTWWRMTGQAFRGFCALMWYGYLPVTARVLGYTPSLGQGTAVPAGVAREWAAWCRHPRYFAGHLSPGDLARFDRVTAPWLSLGFGDDPIANRVTIAELLSHYRQAKITQTFVEPAEVGMSRIGHFGFFSQRAAKSLWPRPVRFFESLLGDVE
jgi:predicted alpha/beta hydrolase